VFVVCDSAAYLAYCRSRRVDDLQLTTQANSKAKATAPWARDCNFIVISFELKISVTRYIGPPIPGGIPPPGIAIPPIGVPGAGPRRRRHHL